MGCVVQFAEELCWKRRDEDCFASSPERTSVLHSGWEGEREGGREGFDFTSVVPSQRLVEDLEYYELAHKAAGKLLTLLHSHISPLFQHGYSLFHHGFPLFHHGGVFALSDHRRCSCQQCV